MTQNTNIMFPEKEFLESILPFYCRNLDCPFEKAILKRIKEIKEHDTKEPENETKK